MGEDKVDLWKTLYFVNLGITFLFLVLLFLTPYQSGQQILDLQLGILNFRLTLGMATAYFFFFIGGLMFIFADLILNGFIGSEILDTITVETNPKYLLQQLGIPALTSFGLAIASGLALGLYYWNGIVVEHKIFMFVPTFFSIQPLSATISPKVYDAFVSSIPVANIEELLFVGILFAMLWQLFNLAISLLMGEGLMGLEKPELLPNVLGMVSAAIVGGFIASYVFHTFVSSYTAYAFADAWRHFTLTSLMAGITGTIIGGVIAHAIHNFAAKTFLQIGSYQVLGGAFGGIK